MNKKAEHWANFLFSQSGYFQFFLSTCLVGLAFGLRTLLAPELGTSIPFTFFVGASILSACFGGWKPGVYSMVLGFLLADWFFVPPLGSFGQHGKVRTIAIVANFLPNVIAILGFELLHRARRALAIAEKELQAAKERIEQDNADLNSEVKRRTFDLQNSLQFLERFCYSIAHDLRAPLRAIRGFAIALEEDYEGKLDSAGKEYLARISQAVLKMDQLITDLLDYARLSHQELEGRDIFLENAVNAAVLGFSERLEEIHAKVQLENLEHVVRADLNLLQDVVRRLLSNSIKFRKPDVSLQVFISSEKKGGLVKVFVRDNGIGIPNDYLQKIFGMFQTLAPSSGIETGAGLAFVAKAVERMQGRVGVTSQPGEGSSFWFELPLGSGRGPERERISTGADTKRPP